MKKFFLIGLAAFAALYLVAELTLDRPGGEGVVVLRWATDPNPARNVQTALFEELLIRHRMPLAPDDILDWPGLCRAIADGRRADGPSVAGALWQRLDDPCRRALLDGADTSDPARQSVLDALNAVLADAAFYRPETCGRLDLPDHAAELLARRDAGLSEAEVLLLNRRVLEAAFPQAIRRAEWIRVTVESGTAEKLIVQCATGTGPDLIDIYNINQMLTYVQAGILTDLTPYADKMGFGPEDTYPALRGALTAEGRQYRFPCNVGADCIVFNKAIFDDHGIAYPEEGWTYDDFTRIAKAIVAGPGKSGATHIAVANWNRGVYLSLLLEHGGRFFTPDGLTSTLDAPPALAAMRLYHDMIHVHQVIPTPAEIASMSGQGGWGAGDLNWFYTQRAAMVFIGRWVLVQVPNYPDLKRKLGSVRLPRVAGDPSRGGIGCRGAAVNAQTAHPRAALEFLRYLAGRPYGELIVKDGDSLPPNPDLARTGADLVNAVVPDPAFHQPFIEAVRHAQPLDASLFIDGNQMDRWLQEVVESVENQLADPETALRRLAAEINQQIRRNVERRPDLRRAYEEVTGRPYTEDWWRTYQHH